MTPLMCIKINYVDTSIFLLVYTVLEIIVCIFLYYHCNQRPLIFIKNVQYFL